MLPEQKRAWFVVGLFVLALTCVAALIPFKGLQAWGGLAVFGLLGLVPLLFHMDRRPGEVGTDERDKAIGRKATLHGGMTSFVVFILASMIPWSVYTHQGKETITIRYLPFITLLGGMVFYVARSVAVLILYGRGKHDGKN